MGTDGDLDPSKYTREQLLGAIGRMNRERYPHNFAILTRELASRPLDSGAATVDTRPLAIQSAATAIGIATALQAFLLFIVLLQGTFMVGAIVTHAALLATFLYQRFALRRADRRVRASLVLLLAFTAVEVAATWSTGQWYTGRGRIISMILDFGRLGGVVIATIQLFRPEGARWLSERNHEGPTPERPARDT
jgi:hypothetical protein